MSDVPFLSPKARSLAGLSEAERQDLLLAAGALGLHDDDLFWMYQAQLCQVKNLILETKTLASESMAEASAVAKQLKPSADQLAAYLRTTVDVTRQSLVKSAVASIASAVTVQFEREVQDRLRFNRYFLLIGGFAAGTICLSLSFAFGVAVGRAGWNIMFVPAAVAAIPASQLIFGQVIFIGFAGVFSFCLFRRSHSVMSKRHKSS